MAAGRSTSANGEKRPSDAPPKAGEASKGWPADRIKRLKVDDLVPYANNARIHTNSQVDQLVVSIRRFGFTNPIVVDESGEIIAGHGRVMAARRMGLTEVPGVVIANGEWSEQDKRAYRIWDNQSALISEWSPEMLKIELEDLKLAEYPMELTGFDNVHLISFLSLGTTDAGQEWKGMPEFSHAPSKLAHRTLTIYFKDQEAVEKFIRTAGIMMTEATRYIWFPQDPNIQPSIDKRYVTAKREKIKADSRNKQTG